MNQSFSPNFQSTRLKIQSGEVMVIRDDLLPGGTKQRASAPFLRDLMDEGETSFIYASPFAGFAQVALAYTAEKLGTQCTIVCEADKTQGSGGAMHPFTRLAQDYGARIHLVDELKDAEDLAHELSHREKSFKIPLGFNNPSFHRHLKNELEVQWVRIEKISPKIKTLWLPLGSGTLTRAFHEVLPSHVSINCVNVHVLGPEDERIRSLSKIKRIKLFEAPMKFHEAAKNLPKIPSNLFYDAKLWDFIKSFAQDQDLWWNVAR